MRIDYVKYNSLRRREHATRTVLGAGLNGERIVRKEPLYPEARPFVLELADKYELMKAAYRNLDICPCRVEGTAVVFDFVEGKSFQDLLVELIVKQDKKAFIDLIYHYRELILDEGRMQTRIMTALPPGFGELFGNFDIARYGLEAVDFSNIDLSFENLIMRDDRWTIFDYEWCFAMPIPVQYVIYRNVGTFYAKQVRKLHAGNFISFGEILKLFDISDEMLSIFAKMEENFQRYVHGGNTEIHERYLKRQLIPKNLQELELAAEQSRDYAKLYWLEGEYTEENAVRVPISAPRLAGKDEVRVELPLKGVPTGRELRVDISQNPCAARLVHCYIANAFGEKIASLKPKSINHNLLFREYYVFLHDDPQMIFDPLPPMDSPEESLLILELLFTGLPPLMDRFRVEVHEREGELFAQIRRHEAELAETHNRLNASQHRVDALQAEYRTDLETLREEYRTAVETLQERHREAEEAMRERHWEEVKALREESQTTVETVHEKMHSELERHADAENILLAEANALREELDNIYRSRGWRWISRLRRLLRRDWREI